MKEARFLASLEKSVGLSRGAAAHFGWDQGLFGLRPHHSLLLPIYLPI
jgi:hypothetical protein